MKRRTKERLRRGGLATALVIGVLSCNNRLQQQEEREADPAPAADVKPGVVECAPLHKNEWRTAGDVMSGADVTAAANILGTSYEMMMLGGVGEAACNQAISLDGNVANTPITVNVVGAAAELCLVGEPPLEGSEPASVQNVLVACPAVPN